MTDGIERLEEAPGPCPVCEHPTWHHYRFIPGAPALGCGNCGHIEYVSDRVAAQVVAGVVRALPKAAAGQIRRVHRTNKRRGGR